WKASRNSVPIATSLRLAQIASSHFPVIGQGDRYYAPRAAQTGAQRRRRSVARIERNDERGGEVTGSGFRHRVSKTPVNAVKAETREPMVYRSSTCFRGFGLPFRRPHIR